MEVKMTNINEKGSFREKVYPTQNDVSLDSSKIKREKDSKKSKKKNEVISIVQLFRFADWIDWILILVGSLASLGASGVYPLMFLYYGEIAGTFVDINKDKAGISNYTGVCTTSSTSTESLNKNYDNRINSAIIYYVIFGFVSLALNYLSHVCWNTASERQIKKMRNSLYKSIIRQNLAFYEKASPGELNSIINSNIEQIKFGIGFKFSDFIILIGKGLASVILSLVTAWKFSIVFLAILPFMTISTVLMVLMIRKYTIEEFKAYGKAGGIAQEILSSIRTVLSLGMQRNAVKDYAENLEQAESMAKKKGLFSGLFSGFTNGLFNLCFGIGIYYGVYLTRIECQTYNPGVIVQAFFSIVTSTFSFGQALPFLKELNEARSAAKKVYEILDTKSEIDVFVEGGKKLDSLKGDIKFENVEFSYPQRKEIQILKGLDISIPAGKTVALVGASGGGKSTVVSLLQRFYLPSKGNIRIDGEKIEDLDLNWIRSQMALVSQEPILFTTSIRENIRLGRLDATDEEIEEAAKSANAHNFIMTTTNKYDTQVGERGTQLSGGQKQRIAIARALIRNPKILLLDEATSALDYESEKIVQEALDKAKIGRTTIIIAHRLSTIRNADMIIYIANGKLVEKGTHDELMELKGEYYKLVKTQSKETEKPELNNQEILSLESSSESEDEKYPEESKTKSDTKPTSSNKVEKRKKPFYYETKLFKLHKPETFWLIAGCISQGVNAAISPATSLLFTEIYKIFSFKTSQEQEAESLKFMGIIFAIGVANFFTSILCSFAFALTGAKLTRRIRVLMFESMLRQEIGFHDLDQNRSSILTTQLAASAAFCKGLSSDKLSLYSQAIAGVGFSLIVGFILNWKLSLVILAFVPITFLSGVFSGRASVSNKVKGKFVNEEGGRLTIETVENIKTIISLGRERHFVKEFEEIFQKKYTKTLLMFHVQAFFYSLTNSILFFVQASAFSFGYYLIKTDGLTVTDLYRVYATLTFSSMILARVYSQLPDQQLSKEAAKIAFKIIDRKSKIDSFSEEGLKPDKVVGDIKFENVYFKYPNRPNIKILNGFNLDIKNGQTNALVGPSGCGKSTTIALLLRFYDVESGTVYLDGVDIRKLNINWLRQHIGLVSQEPVLFNRSIFENICLGDLNRNDIQIHEVVQAALNSNIHNKIETLPDKYQTFVGSKGGQLSGGEKQRVAIARALIRKPNILLLDEATSALDNQSEQIVQDALDKAQKGRTCIVIAHRLSTIQNADKITVVKDGIVLEEGNHATLMYNKNFYYKLQNQNKSKADF